ncbi:CoA-transferase family III domain-containing protein [Phyllosticta citrichinensis]|uniref:CoA-transferase family III domain-containing protein n=1 Tax=Phyllosticta citrichinensis TaxID=1130410 RepID=A0ABR1XFK9_9PEZI
MAGYSVQGEAQRILQENLLEDARLGISRSVADASKKIEFTGGDSQPFVPSPCKMTESGSALTALVAASGSAVAADRYGIEHQEIEVNTDVATLFLESVLLPTINGQHYLKNEHMQKEMAKADIYQMSEPIHRFSTNVYQTKDGRWYHLHGSMNAGPTMKMMQVEEQQASEDEAKKIYADKVAQWDSTEIEKTANEEFKQAGTVCNFPEEFFASEHGKIMGEEPLWTSRTLPAPRKPWPQVSADSEYKPLAGIKIVDFSRVIAAPAISKILALLGADVLKISNTNLPEVGAVMIELNTGKRDASLDLKTPEGRKAFTELVEDADVLVDGYRPGVLSRLGFDSASLRKLNPTLIYVRENCYGFKGPLSYRSGWQQISDCLVGISWLQGKFLGLNEPVVPLFRKYMNASDSPPALMKIAANSDYQTGLTGAAAVLGALLARTKDDVTYDIDVSLTQYNIWYYRLGQYDEEQQTQLRNRNQGFEVRHDDDMLNLVMKTHAAIKLSRPDIFTHPEYFCNMSGKEWGLEDDIVILAPAFKYGKSKLGYSVPSGSRGRSKPEWLS